MKKLFGIIPTVCTLLLVAIFLSLPQPVNAADVRTGNEIILSPTQSPLKDLYLFGNTVQVNAPVTNDIVTGGNIVNITGSVSNELIAGGSNVIIRGKIGNTARVAGGTVIVDAPVTHDLVIAGGTITIGKNATIGGDLMAAGGQVNIEGPVHGKILMTGGNVTLNGTVNGDVKAWDIKKLTLGPQAKINGSLIYSSAQPALVENGAQVLGQTSYHRIVKQQEQQQQAAQTAITTGIYKLVTDIILSLLLIYFFRRGMLIVLTRMQTSPWKSGGIGFVYVLLAPLASVILLILIWLGIASILAYILAIIISIFITKIFIGWLLMTWWDKRQKHAYMLDWKAGVVGPIVLFILLLIPVLGWLVAAMIFFIAIGAFLGELVDLVPQLQHVKKK